MKIRFDITAQELEIVRGVLSRHLGGDCKVWVFGSRAKNKTRFNSDLDIAVECGSKLPHKSVSELKEAFDESKLPFAVDVVDMGAVEPYFRQIIDAQKVAFPLKPKTPSLRFAEFDGEWEEKRLRDVLSVSSQKITESPQALKCVELEHISQETGVLLGYSSTNKFGSAKNIFKKGEVLFGKLRPYLKKYWHATFDGVCSSEILVVNGIDLINKYVFQFIQTDKFNEIANISSGSKMPRADWGYISEVLFCFPQKQEQQKIADFLTAVDARIEALTKQRELMERYKKGVMQKIFSQEMRFRADDGSEFPEWEEYKLNNVLMQESREINKPSTNYLAIGVRSHCKGTFQKLDSEPEKNAMDKLYVVKENDLIVNITFAWERAIAIAKKEDDGGLVSHRFPTYTFNSKISSSNFFKYVIIQKRFGLMLDLISPGGAGRNRVMSKKDFLELVVVLPSLAEQTKIADFLSSIDKKIDSVSAQLQSAKNFKKALLQQMFV